MAKRKKHPALPNGFGSIRYLGKNRSNPYAVHPPATETDEHGNYIRPKALCYVDDWYVGFAVLNAYHAGTYNPGDEIKFKQYRSMDDYAMDDFCKRILADFTSNSFAKNVHKESEKTFAEVYEMFYDWKFGPNVKKKLSESSKASTKCAYNNLSALHDRVFKDLRHADLQACIDDCPLRASSIIKMVSLIKQMYKFAILYEICDKDFSRSLQPPPDDNEHGVPFSVEDLRILWKNKNDPTVELLLIMCYSGFRISAYLTLEINLKERYFRGGIKTESGKDRIVPIHSAIYPLVEKRLARDGCIMNTTTKSVRKYMDKALESLNIDRHTPHDCRHTFSALCEKYKVNENDRKRMLGHSFGNDITNGIYGHRTAEELREEIEKIPGESI